MSTPSSLTAATPSLSTLLLLDLPSQSFVGIDLLSFTTSSRFSGIKCIPPGLHHLYYTPGHGKTAASSTPTASTRTLDLSLNEANAFNLRSGFWFEAKGTPDDIVIKRWDPMKEDFVDENELSVDEIFKIKANLGNIYNNNLTFYRQLAGTTGSANLTSDSRLWKDLVSHISSRLLDHILVGTHDISSSRLLFPGPSKWKIRTTSCSAIDYEDVLSITPMHNERTIEARINLETPHYSSDEQEINELLNLLPIDLMRTFPPGSIGRERTIAAKDRSWYLNMILSRYSSEEERDSNLLGELQFCYITSLTLANYSCIEQWRRILGVALTCEECIPLKVTFFKSILEILISQFRALDVLGSPASSSVVSHTGEAREDSSSNFLIDFLEGSGKSTISIQKLLRSFLRTLRALKKDDPSIASSIDGLIEVFNDLEELTQLNFDWTLDTNKIVKKGTIQLEDGEIVEMDLDELGAEEDEEDEKGEWAPVIVEL